VPVEIEHRFLVASDAWHPASPGLAIRQGYLTTTPACVVRVRIADTSAWLTVKGETRGARRSEFEYPIPVPDAEAMMAECCGDRLVEKVRHSEWWDGRHWVVDRFLGRNAGLVLAELEVSDEDAPFTRPPWLGAEVTHRSEYTNASLAVRPYGAWLSSRA
jgi:adenylate cyclase